MDYPFWIRLLLKLLLLRIKRVEGLEFLPQKGGFILAANHESFLDGFVLAAAVYKKLHLKMYFLAYHKYWDFPGGKKLAEIAGAVLINPKNKASCLETLKHYLKKGGIGIIFPEGKRNTSSILKKGKTGIARLALATKLPVIPVGIKTPPTWSIWQILKNIMWWRKCAFIKFGPEVTFQEFYNLKITKEVLEKITRKIMVAIGKLVNKAYPY